MSARPALKFKPRRGNAFCASRRVSENSELFKKPEPSAQFQWERTSSTIQPRRSLRGSEVEPTTSFRYSSFRGRERSLDPERLRRAVWHSQTNGASLLGLRRPSALESDLKQGKTYLPFVSTPRPPTRIGRSMKVFQQARGSPDQAYPNPHCMYDQFCSSWRSGPNHTPRMRTGPSLQLKCLGRVSKHRAANLRFCQNWPWLLLVVRTRQLTSSQPLYPGGGIQRLWYYQRTRKPLL